MGIPSTVGKLAHDRAGNLGMAAAIVIPMLLAGIGLVVDYGSMINSQDHLQAAMDSAAVAAVSSLSAGHSDTESIKAYAKNVLLAQMGSDLNAAQRSEISSNLVVTTSKVVSGSVTTYNIKSKGNYSIPLTAFALFLGKTSAPVGAVSTAQSQTVAKNALSMYLVLDRSGSMSFVTDTVFSTTTRCQNYTVDNWGYYPNLGKTKPCYVNKISALKSAAASLFTTLDDLEAKDASDTIVRVGAVSFHDAMQTPSDIACGTPTAKTYVNALPAYPDGGTDMTGGLKQAYDSLRAATETSAHTAKGNKTFSKFIVLMTDGENTGASAPAIWDPALDANALSTCTLARNAGMTIYAVAFMAPDNGKTMLKACAGSTANYYEAGDMESLVSAFKEIGNRAAEQTARLLN